MDARRLKRLLSLVAALIVGAALGYALRGPVEQPAADVRAVADSALLSVREQGRLIVFTARFASVVTASENRLGLTARKTLIMPATVRYGVDLARLRRENLAWDEATKTLSVTLPPLEISRPSIDLNDVQEYGEGGIVMALTDSERALDEANQRNAQDELMRQARARPAMQLAQNAAMRTVARSFALPLRAAGIDASVAVRLVDPAGREEAAFLDPARRVAEALDDRRAGPLANAVNGE